MILSEKIIQMRKQLGWSQEELANQLGVSRQSVSKWEVGAAIPDLDKILKMGELFSVSTDFLLKDDMEVVEYSGQSVDNLDRTVSAEEADSYMSLVASDAKRFALAIAGFIVSPVCLIQMSELSDAGLLTEKVASAIGLLFLFGLIAAGVAVCINHGMKLSRYEYLEEEPFSLSYGVSGIVEKRKTEFEPTHRHRLVSGVAMIIIGIIPLVVTGSLEMPELVVITCVSLLLILIAAAVYGFIWTGLIHGSYNTLLQVDDYTKESKRTQKKLAPFSSAYWLLMTAVYLAISFYTNAWDRSWILWPVAAVLFAALYRILQGVVSGKNK